jgi:hypothetical protein
LPRSSLFIFLLILLFIFSCEKDNPVTPENFPPVLSNLIVPDTVITNINQRFIFSVICTDENGLDDIDSVFYQIFSLTERFITSGIMFDDGDYSNHGDNVPKDGKYSIRLKLDLAEGYYRFIVKAIDRTQLESDALTDTFYAKPGVINQAPTVSKYHIPDTVYVDEIVPFYISVRASDPDSLDYISRVTYQILGPVVTELAEEGELFDSGIKGDSLAGDGIFSIETSTAFANWKFGEYHLMIYAFDNHNKTSNSIYEILPWAKINLGVAPQLISVTAPDTIKLPTTDAESYVLTATALDEDNNRDIQEVFFNTFKPDGSPSIGNPFKMYDNGINEDRVAGDNIYSLLIWISPQNLPGNYRFEFQAKDYSNLLSNKIIHTITVIQ